MECYEVIIVAPDGSTRTLLALTYSREEADLVRVAVERSLTFSGSVILCRSLGRFQISRE